MDYNFFLFCKLADAYKRHNTMIEYDEQFTALRRMYQQYEDSPFNRAASTHSCMENYLLSLPEVEQLETV